MSISVTIQKYCVIKRHRSLFPNKKINIQNWTASAHPTLIKILIIKKHTHTQYNDKYQFLYSVTLIHICKNC